MKKICVITCYREPDYVRAKVLRRAIQLSKHHQAVIVKNSHTGLFRYIEVALKVAVTRLIIRPDYYLLTFRGYEILPAIRLITAGKPLIYDEFINPIEWIAYEHKKVNPNGLPAKLIHALYRVMANSVQLVMTDTRSHAEYSATLMKIPLNKYAPLPVGADEQVFKPDSKAKHEEQSFTVFFYGNMLPLHGIGVVLKAAVAAKDLPVIFRLIGGDGKIEKDVKEAVDQGAHINYSPRVPFEQLAEEATNADLCLGGPFGGTIQGSMVITGKTFQFLAAGKPTVIGDNLESHAFTDKKNILVVKQNDIDDIVKVLKWAIANRHTLPTIGNEGRKLFEERYSTPIIKKSLLAYLERV